MVRKIESVKPVAWFASRQVAITPNGGSPLAQSNMVR